MNDTFEQQEVLVVERAHDDTHQGAPVDRGQRPFERQRFGGFDRIHDGADRRFQMNLEARGARPQRRIRVHPSHEGRKNEALLCWLGAVSACSRGDEQPDWHGTKDRHGAPLPVVDSSPTTTGMARVAPANEHCTDLRYS